MIVVILGPDGCGKSSVIERLQNDLSSAFSEVRVLHLRPRLGRGGMREGPPVLDPHNLPPRGPLFSVAKLFYLLIDYGTLYPSKLRMRLGSFAGLIVFDRYFHDLLVDPRRYRYGAPMWLARLVGRIVPSPDLWILLDAPPEVIRSRKQEVSLSESIRQRQAYLDLMRGFRNAHVVDASVPLEEVSRSVERIIRERR